MIYYDIQFHGEITRINWLVKHLQHPRSLINLSYDGERENLDLIRQNCSDCESEVFVDSSIPVTWCGPSQIIQMKKSLEKALNRGNWEYYINLSGVDIPLLSQIDLIARLNFERCENNKTSFCFGFAPKKEAYWLMQSGNFERIERKYLRLDIVCDDQVDKEINLGKLAPTHHIMQRRALHCEEIGAKKLLLRSLNASEIRERKDFWAQNQYMVGRTWMVLHRKQIEWLMDSKLFAAMYEHLLTTFEPDETLCPSVLFSKENPFLGELSRDNLRYGLGSPHYLSRGDLTKVIDSGACFARKIGPSITNADLDIVSKALR